MTSDIERPKVGRPIKYSPEQLLDRLVQAAVDLLDEQAADVDFSVAQIAARAQVSKKTFYTVIAGKEELIALLMNRNVQTATELLAPPVPDAAAARDVLARFLTQWAMLACGAQAVGIYVLAIRERSRYPAIGAAYYRSRDELGMQQLAAWLARMHRKKFLRLADPALTADFVLTMVASERQRKLALGLDAPITQAQLRQRVTAILKLVFGDTA